MAVRARLRCALIAGAAILATPAFPQDLPLVPASLLEASSVVCISISRGGEVRGAFIVTSTGNAIADRDLLSWVRQLRWPVATSDEKMRDTWFPMPVAFGGSSPRKAPSSCGPTA